MMEGLTAPSVRRKRTHPGTRKQPQAIRRADRAVVSQKALKPTSNGLENTLLNLQECLEFSGLSPTQRCPILTELPIEEPCNVPLED